MDVFPKPVGRSASLRRGQAGARRVRATARCLLAFAYGLAVHGANAEDPIRIELGGVTRDQVKNEIVLFTTRDSKFRLSQETNFQLSFDRDADNVKGNLVYQASKPVMRTTYTIADTLNGVQVVVNTFLIENVGTPLEKRTVLVSDDETHAVQDVLKLVKQNLQAMTKKATVESLPRFYQHVDSLNRPGTEQKPAPKVLTGKDVKEIPQRLGFSAELSKDSSQSGFVVVSVEPNTPADAAGLQANDIVTSIDGKSIKTSDDMEAAKAKMKKKRRGKMQIIRDGKQYDATLKLK